MKHWGRSIFLGFLIVSVAGVSLGQTRDGASISGRVTDESGGVVPGVALVLRNEATGHVHTAVSRETGDFLFPFLPTGSYTLTAELPGFSRLKLEGIQLTLNQESNLPVTLKVGTPETEVIVAADANRIETKNVSIRHLINEDQIRDLPVLTNDLDGRNMMGYLLALTPGAVQYDLMGFSGNSTALVSINGSPIAGVGFTFDGIDNTSLAFTGPLTDGPNPDVVREFSLVTHTFKAESGRHSAIVHMETKSGGNNFHGQGRIIHLNPDLSARDFFDMNRKTRPTMTNWGLQFSGPVMLPRLYDGHNKTFFLLDHESNSSMWRESTKVTTLSDAERVGDFSGDPKEHWPVDPLTGEVFPGGRIPSGRILPQSRRFIDRIIRRADQGREADVWHVHDSGSAQGTARIDHQISPSHLVNVSLFVNTTHYDDPHLVTNAIDKLRTRGHNLALRHTHNFSPLAANSILFGRSFNDFNMGVQAVERIDLRREGFAITPAGTGPASFPFVSVVGTSGFEPGAVTWFSKESNWTFKDDFSLNRASHALKFGGEIQWLRSETRDRWSSQPRFVFAGFNPFGSGSGVADFLLGIPLFYWQSSEASGFPRRAVGAVYLQDDYKIRSNLTVNLGLRYEINGVWSVRDRRHVAFRPDARSQMFPDAPVGVIFAGDRDPWTGQTLGKALTPPDHNNFAPRLGIAYSPSAATGLLARLLGRPGRTSVRAGYGIYYTYSRANVVNNLTYVAPYFTSVFRDAGQISGAAGNFANPWGTDVDVFTLPLAQRGFPLPLWGVNLVEPGFRDPYQHHWSLSIQRQLSGSTMAEVAYVGNTALHLPRRFQVNPGMITPNATPGNVQARRKYKDFGGVTGYASDGVSTYHALQLHLNRRFARGLQLNASYVWSKALDNVGSNSMWLYEFGDRDTATWARANFDRRHQFTFQGVWQLPGIDRVKIVNRVLSGWQAVGIVRLAAGIPLNIRNPFDSTLRDVEAGPPDIVGPFQKLNPREVRTFQLPNGQRVTGNFLFDPTVFRVVRPARGDPHAGNLGRNAFSAPGVNNVDLSLLKRIPLRENHRLELRMDISNLFNHAQFLLARRPGTIVTSPFFARTERTTGPRRLQFLLRYSF